MSRPSEKERFRRNLADALLSDEWTGEALRKNARRATGGSPRWVAPLVKRLLKEFTAQPNLHRLLRFVYQDRALARLETFPVWTIFVPPKRMTPPPAAAGPVILPQLATEGALADWLDVPLATLLWCADTRGINRRHPPGRLRTYRYRWIAKPGGRSRLLEIPIRPLKWMQKQVLEQILDRIPAHPSAHGFRPGHSIRSNAIPHCGKRVVIRFDLNDFFPSVAAARIHRMFRTFGYPERVGRLLTGLCTTSLPRDVWDSRPNRREDGSDEAVWQRFAGRHLPQGAPTSPALANLAAFRLDRRLSRLAARLDADYTRYADDLTFSGGETLHRRVQRVRDLVAVIVLEEGFCLNYRKTRVMPNSGRQHVTGVVVNAKPNVSRPEFDRLKATLTNCIRLGPASQNRDGHPDFRSHLAGLVSHVRSINSGRGQKLAALFERITWQDESSVSSQ